MIDSKNMQTCHTKQRKLTHNTWIYLISQATVLLLVANALSAFFTMSKVRQRIISFGVVWITKLASACLLKVAVGVSCFYKFQHHVVNKSVVLLKKTEMFEIIIEQYRGTDILFKSNHILSFTLYLISYFR